MKSILTASSILILSIASFFTQADINITFNTPSAVSAGESFVLDIELDKGDISNFAKLQLNFPEGFTAELLEGKGGTFTFYDQKMKLIWISLPSDPKFNVKVKVTTEKSIAGDFNINGKISYVIDGERSSKDLVTNNINVSPNANKNSPATATTSAGTTGVGIKPTNNGEAELTCSRSFDASQVAPGETFLVELKVKKSNVSGVGKIIENIPEGFTAQEVQTNGAIFSQKGTQVKFLWMTLPAEDEFTVSYKIVVASGISGNKVIDGKMSFLDGSDTRYAIIEGTSVEVTDSPVATVATQTQSTTSTSTDNGGSDDGSTDDGSTDDGSTDDGGSDDGDAQTATSQVTPSTDDSDTGNSDSGNDGNADVGNSDAASSQSGKEDDNGNVLNDNPMGGGDDHQVNYRVQICALKTQVPTAYFVKNHNVTEHIYLNQHEGWNKYTVGDFKEYMGAQNHREIAKDNYKIKGPFVTAYNNGTRITVQEALMITKDEWKAPQ